MYKVWKYATGKSKTFYTPCALENVKDENIINTYNCFSRLAYDCALSEGSDFEEEHKLQRSETKCSRKYLDLRTTKLLENL